MSKKFGLNEYNVLVSTRGTFDDAPKKCRWIGHSRFKCGNCKLGYFNVRTEFEYDVECPECKAIIFLRFTNED